jgi:hypothetical protein
VGSNVWFPLVPFGSEIPMLRCSDGSLGMRMLFCDFHFYFAVIRTSFAAFFWRITNCCRSLSYLCHVYLK